ncbi:MAG: type IV-A pilus assembly ATPase PilB [Myxococcota bacterium]|nr:type IV-A pilus assembly ATPase PilB [Myxococcota bacterium]
MEKTERIGELLLREGVISVEQLQRAQVEQRQSGRRLGEILSEAGTVDEQELVACLSAQYQVPSINLEDFEIDPSVLQLLPVAVAEKHCLLPIDRTGQTMVVAMADPSNIHAIDDVKFLLGYNVEVVVAAESQIKAAIAGHYGTDMDGTYQQVMQQLDDSEIEFDVGDGDEFFEADAGADAADEAPVVKLVNLVLVDAIRRGASDIHIESYESSFRVRYRIDGALYEVMKPPTKFRDAVVSRLKIMSRLDIAERRLPQDGRIKMKLGKGQSMDFRVSVLPTLFGEKVVLRLLDKSNLQLDMTKLGFEKDCLSAFKKAIHRPHGMVLVTGPTGSGKTTTLYSALSDLNKSTANISTAEDPVEFNLYGINQVQMHEDIGLNFAAGLRSFLRQDPDIIMVGEIRDFETAEIAIKAALTGHLVLSTLHTNDAASTVSRMLNMGIEPFLLTASLNAVVAQRLVRKICEDCKHEIEVERDFLLDIQIPEDDIGRFTIYEGRGCRSCSETGYKGRLAIYEVLVMTEGLKDLLINGATGAELKMEARREGMRTLRQSALLKLEEGMITVEEVVRVSVAD